MIKSIFSLIDKQPGCSPLGMKISIYYFPSSTVPDLYLSVTWWETKNNQNWLDASNAAQIKWFHSCPFSLEKRKRIIEIPSRKWTFPQNILAVAKFCIILLHSKTLIYFHLDINNIHRWKQLFNSSIIFCLESRQHKCLNKK